MCRMGGASCQSLSVLLHTGQVVHAGRDAEPIISLHSANHSVDLLPTWWRWQWSSLLHHSTPCCLCCIQGMYTLATAFCCQDHYATPGFPRFLVSLGIFTGKFPRPGMSWKMTLVLESSGNLLARSWKVLEFARQWSTWQFLVSNRRFCRRKYPQLLPRFLGYRYANNAPPQTLLGSSQHFPYPLAAVCCYRKREIKGRGRKG